MCTGSGLECVGWPPLCVLVGRQLGRAHPPSAVLHGSMVRYWAMQKGHSLAPTNRCNRDPLHEGGRLWLVWLVWVAGGRLGGSRRAARAAGRKGSTRDNACNPGVGTLLFLPSLVQEMPYMMAYVSVWLGASYGAHTPWRHYRLFSMSKVVEK